MPQESHLSFIEALYRCPNQADVRRFLCDHPDVADVLLVSYTLVERVFGPKPVIALSVVRGLQGSDSATLFADVLTPLRVTEAFDRLAVLDNAMFRAQIGHEPERLCFDVVPARRPAGDHSEPGGNGAGGRREAAAPLRREKASVAPIRKR